MMNGSAVDNVRLGKTARRSKFGRLARCWLQIDDRARVLNQLQPRGQRLLADRPRNHTAGGECGTKLHVSHVHHAHVPNPSHPRRLHPSRPSPTTRRRSSRVWQRHVWRVITCRTCVLSAGLTIKILTYGISRFINCTCSNCRDAVSY